jgi:hypothetical protein
MPVPVIQVRPPAGVFYTCFYNITITTPVVYRPRLELETILYLELSRSSNGYFKALLDLGGSFRIETAVMLPFRK